MSGGMHADPRLVPYAEKSSASIIVATAPLCLPSGAPSSRTFLVHDACFLHIVGVDEPEGKKGTKEEAGGRQNEGPTLPRLITFVVFYAPPPLRSHAYTVQLTTIHEGYMSARLLHTDDAMSTPIPLAGRLVPLRTKDEVRASLETHSAYVVEVPAKFANVVKE
jgi:hypothetical protein